MMPSGRLHQFYTSCVANTSGLVFPGPDGGCFEQDVRSLDAKVVDEPAVLSFSTELPDHPLSRLVPSDKVPSLLGLENLERERDRSYLAKPRLQVAPLPHLSVFRR